jgi:hypothetical protein
VQTRAVPSTPITSNFVVELTKPAEGSAFGLRKRREITPVQMVATLERGLRDSDYRVSHVCARLSGRRRGEDCMDLLLTGKARVLPLVTCAVLTCGCQSGVHSSVAPSAVSSVSASTGSNSAVVMPGDVITMQGAPVSYPMNEVIANGSYSGYSGTCTVASTHTGGLRVKADGQGVANERIQFNVVDVTEGSLHLRTTDYIDVNQQGSFRTGWSPIEPGDFSAEAVLQCQLTKGSDNVLASSSSTFTAP